MTNLRTDKMVFFRNLTKIDTDENKAIYSNTWLRFAYRWRKQVFQILY